MIKIQDEKGETVFVVKDDATKPERVEDKGFGQEIDFCDKCKQSGPNKPGEYPCPVCKRNLLHDEDLKEDK